MKRAINFNAGPAAIPQEVLEQAQAEMLDWKGTGMSVMEVSHRSKEYEEMHNHAQASFQRDRGHGRGLEDHLPHGRSELAVLHAADEHASGRREGRLSRHRPLEQGRGQGSQALWADRRDLQREGRNLPLHPQAVRDQARSRCRLCAHDEQQHHIRHAMGLLAGGRAAFRSSPTCRATSSPGLSPSTNSP